MCVGHLVPVSDQHLFGSCDSLSFSTFYTPLLLQRLTPAFSLLSGYLTLTKTPSIYGYISVEDFTSQQNATKMIVMTRMMASLLQVAIIPFDS